MPRIVERYDNNNDYDWSYIRTTYSKGRVAEVYTLYDDGSEGVQSFNRGTLLSETRTDNPSDSSTNPWTEITTTYEASGAVASVHTFYDNGTTQDDQYAGGVITESTLYDDPATNAEAWELIERYYDGTGQLQQQVTYDDDGKILDESFSNGVIASSVLYDDPVTQAEVWERIESQYDGVGQLQQQVTYFDNGTILDESFSGGVITSSVHYDDPATNAEAWERVESQYDSAGQLQRQVTFFDNGVIDDVQYQNGQIAQRTQSDGPYTNAEAWEHIDSFYDASGQLQEQVIVFDTGVIDHSQYQNGTISSRTQYDDPYTNAEVWQQIDSFYDATGQLQEQVIVFDTGVIDHSQYQNGTISSRTQYDDPYTNAETWQQIDSFYDASGQLQEQVIVLDNGVIDHTQYQNGTISMRSQFDDPYTNAEAWQQIDSFYDGAGQLQQEITFYDNGIFDELQFYNGTQTHRLQTDDPYTNAADWQQIETYFDGSGEISSEVTFYDDGRVTDRYYENGQLQQEASYDDPYGMNLYDWEAQLFEFDTDGQVTLAAKLYDDGDYERDDYDAAGNLAIHWDYDGDGDETWLGRRVDYAPDGSEVETTYWYEGDTLPPELTDSSYVMTAV